jgi:GH15 family glucan-1,4-alpha-glucosidase
MLTTRALSRDVRPARDPGWRQVGSAAVDTRFPTKPRSFAPIGAYAAIGDGRTVALVARDGSVDWLCLPDLDSPSVFAAVLDADRGGRFALQPAGSAEVEQRYLPDTNVLETTFVTGDGVVRVTDALTLPVTGGLGPTRELARRVDGLAGRVPMRWSVEPAFGYAGTRPRLERRGRIPVAVAGRDAVAVCTWEAGEPAIDGAAVRGRFEAHEGSSALIVLCASHQEPLVFPARADVEARLEATIGYWREWASTRRYAGRWREAVIRSALALKLLFHSPSGAIAAAATASLPEQIGGERNWDYRFCWVRDSAFTLDALLQLGCPREADAFFWWLLHASQLTHPRLQVLYRLDGAERAPERTLPLDGYRDSRPVRVGNAAAAQSQLDIYGDVLQTALIYVHAGGRLDRETGRRLAGMADLVCRIWREPDSGIWEVRSQPRHFTHSKMMCWVALDRALALSAAGQLPSGSAAAWQAHRHAISEFIETRCWSPRIESYTRDADSEELDASLLLGVLLGYGAPDAGRLRSTVNAIRRDLGRGPLLHRYSGEDGLRGGEGAFLCCSFWLADALARIGSVGEATQLMEQLMPLAGDVGLYAEELDPDTGELLGNTPQGLVHLALINAAVSITRAVGR